MEALDEAGLPDDEPFRQAVRSHVEFGAPRRPAELAGRNRRRPALDPGSPALAIAGLGDRARLAAQLYDGLARWDASFDFAAERPPDLARVTPQPALDRLERPSPRYEPSASGSFAATSQMCPSGSVRLAVRIPHSRFIGPLSSATTPVASSAHTESASST